MSINSWGSNDPAEVAKGGTGNSTLTDHGVLLGSGTAAVTVTAAPTNGQLLIGSTGADPSVAAPTGDTNEIAITTGAGTLAIGIADNPVIPGTADIQIPSGTTAQQPSATNGMLRYDTTTNKLRAVINSAWADVSTGAAGSFVYLTTTTITSSTATIDFTNTTIATYKHFYFVVVATPDSTNRMEVYISNDNGSSYHVTNYQSTGARRSTTGTWSGATVATKFITDEPSTNVGTGVPGMWGEGWLLWPLDASRQTCWRWIGGSTSAGSAVETSASGFYVTAEANNAIRFQFLSSNTSAAQIDVYGIADS